MNKISVLIPVYNVEAYLEQCLESVVKQTEKNIEIICVDDASTDGSLEILERFRKKDQRVKLICHEENQGICKTRKDAVLASNGKYIMFLDSDDYIALNACEKLYKSMEDVNVDVIQFGTELLYDEKISEELAEWTRNFMEPSTDKVTEKELVRACFIESKLNCNLVNKVWNGTCCRQAVKWLDDGKYVAAEDRYICFLLLFFMKSYAGIKEKYYFYRLGAGVTGASILDLRRFRKRCNGAVVADRVKEFLQEQNVFEKYKDVYTQFYNDILWDCADCWYRKLEKANQPEGFKILLKYWTPGEIIGALARTFFEEQEKIEQSLKNEETKKIAIYYRYVGYEAMDTVIKKYADYHAARGREIILLTDSDAPETGKQYMGYRLMHLPAATDSNWDRYAARGQALDIEMAGVDKMIYLSPTSHVLILDKVVAEACGVKFQTVMDEYALDQSTSVTKRLRDELQEMKAGQETIMNELRKSKAQYEIALENLRCEKQELEEQIKHIYETKCGKIMKLVHTLSYQLRHMLE